MWRYQALRHRSPSPGEPPTTRRRSRAAQTAPRRPPVMKASGDIEGTSECSGSHGASGDSALLRLAELYKASRARRLRRGKDSTRFATVMPGRIAEWRAAECDVGTPRPQLDPDHGRYVSACVDRRRPVRWLPRSRRRSTKDKCSGAFGGRRVVSEVLFRAREGSDLHLRASMAGSSKVERLTLDQEVGGSSPPPPATSP